VTFLFTDIAGSTRLWQAHPEAMVQAYARHDAILREAIGQHGGVVFKTIGDAFQVAFRTAPAAVTAVLEAQQGLQAENWAALGLPEPLRVRMALHTGAVDPDPDGDYRSPVLNRLGRLLGAGHGGQVLLSDAVQALVRDRLPTGASLRDLGAHQLKDLLQPERIHQLVHPDLEADFALLVTLSTRPHNLPRQPTPFLGRARDVAQVAALLRQDSVQLVTLTGSGGTGKTRLSLQVAAELVEAFPDGVWFVELASLTDPALVPSAIAEVLGVREAGPQSLHQALIEHLREKALLLVLDNLEQVLPAAAPAIGALIAAAAGLKVLATSRGPLRLRAEHEVPVAPLALPRRKPPPTMAQLGQYDAVRLFIERAQAVNPAFAVTNDNAPAVAEICHRLDGLPLAIELAAARIRLLPPAAMLRRLTQRLAFLTGGARDVPVRQQTLREAIAWSYDLLTPDEQALYRRLAVFAGGWTLEAAEAVAGSPGSGELALDVLDGLERLAEHSLLRQEVALDGEPRFLMLETIREYGLEQLELSSEVDEAHQRHAVHFLALSEQADTNRKGPDHKVWLDRVDQEHDNLRAALGWTLAHDPPMALRLVANMAGLWLRQGYLTEAREWLERALAAAPAGTLADVRVVALNWASQIAGNQADVEATERWGREALELARSLGNVKEMSFALVALSTAADWRGEHAHAIALLEEGVTVCREIGDADLIGDALNSLGYTHYIQGNLDAARSLVREAVELHRAGAFSGSLGNTLHSLGDVLRASGDLEGARGAYREAVEVAQDASWMPIVLLGVEGLAMVEAIAGDAARAARLLGTTDALRDDIGFAHEPDLVADHERTIAILRNALGEEAFTVAWETGRRRSLDEAVTEALGPDAD